VAGLDSFTNPSDDATPGRNEEQDGPARTRRLRELHAQGQGPLATIAGVVSQVVGVVSVRVYHNPSVQPVDSDSIPFKGFNVVVETSPVVPTTAQQDAIFAAIWSAMGAGGQAYGTDFVGTIVDSEGTNQPVAFDTVAVLDIVLELDLVTSTSELAITPNIEQIVADKVLATANAEHEFPGRDVLALDYQGIVQTMVVAGEISGVDAVNVRMSVSPAAPTAVAKLSVGIREKSDFDSANITVAQV
jgi:hypothetical protein